MKKILIFIILILLFTANMFAFAGGNNASLPSNPTTITGPDAWQYNDDVEAMRYSIYWAKETEDQSAEENFADNVEVRKLGQADISKTGLHYQVDNYTIYTIFDYMNPGVNGEIQTEYTAISNEDNPYSWKDADSENESLLNEMPAVYRDNYEEALAGQQEWREFFLGPYVNGEPTYENVEVLARVAGTQISAEDFKSGEFEVIPGFKEKGVYKIYAEPMINAVVDGYGQISTFRDLIRQEYDWEASDPAYTLTGWLTPAFVITGNSMILIDEEPEDSIDMRKCNTNVDGIPLEYDHETRVIDRVKIRHLISEGQEAYKSMGVGVFDTPKPKLGNIEMVGVEVLNGSGEVVNHIVQDREYKVRFYAEYDGKDIDEEVIVDLISTNVLNLENGDTLYIDKDTILRKETTLEDEKIYVFETEYFTAFENRLYAQTTAKADPVFNTDNSDDFIDIKLGGAVPNLSLTIDSISPNNTKVYEPAPDIDTSYTVNYSVYFDSVEGNYILPSKVRFNLNGNSITTPNNLSQDIDVDLEPGRNEFVVYTGGVNAKNTNGEFYISLEVNPDRDMPDEEETFLDNKDTITQNVTSIPDGALNPCTGTIHKQNSWPVTYTITGRQGEDREYYEVRKSRCNEWEYLEEGGRICIDREYYYVTRSRCVGGSNYYDQRTSTRSEHLRITAVNFKSKDSDVNLINEDGLIKAGYGFELELIAKYTGTESPSRPSTSGSCNRRSVSPGRYRLDHNLPNRLYVVLPDGQFISNFEAPGMRNLLDCYRSGVNTNSQTVRCEIKEGNTFGNAVTRKLYVEDTTRDGRYKITVCTDNISPTSPEDNRLLYDEKNVYFEVNGKHTDDVTTHIVQ